MSFFRKLLGRDKTEAPTGLSSPDVIPTASQPMGDPPLDPHAQAPSPDNGPKVYIPGQPHTNVSAIQNAGMLGGAVLGEGGTAGVGGGAVDGLVVGNLVGQQINQARKHEYWREQSLNYQAGLPAAGVGDPNVISPSGPRDRSSREERRKKRWSRRAENRAG